MAQLFGPRANIWMALFLVGLPLVAISLYGAAWLWYGSPFFTGETYAPDQPVPFSHEHHVGGLGIDCRYCHASVEKAAFAGIPATHVCMSCHSQVWAEAQMLAPVRESYATGKPIGWTRVYDLPDYVFFHHGAHVANGVGCSTCHGAVDTMPLIRKTNELTMKWCLSCHIDPAPQLREPGAIFQMQWAPRAEGDAKGDALLKHYQIPKQRMRDCYVCHR